MVGGIGFCRQSTLFFEQIGAGFIGLPDFFLQAIPLLKRPAGFIRKHGVEPIASVYHSRLDCFFDAAVQFSAGLLNEILRIGPHYKLTHAAKN